MKLQLNLFLIITLMMATVFPVGGQCLSAMLERLDSVEELIEETVTSSKTIKGGKLFGTECCFANYGLALDIIESQLGQFNEEAASQSEPGTDSGPDP